MYRRTRHCLGQKGEDKSSSRNRFGTLIEGTPEMNTLVAKFASPLHFWYCDIGTSTMKFVLQMFVILRNSSCQMIACRRRSFYTVYFNVFKFYVCTMAKFIECTILTFRKVTKIFARFFNDIVLYCALRTVILESQGCSNPLFLSTDISSPC